MSLDDSRDVFAEVWRRQLQEGENIRYADGDDADTLQETGLGIIAVFDANTDPEEEVLAVSQALAVPVITSDNRVLDDPLICERDLVVRDRDGHIAVGDRPVVHIIPQPLVTGCLAI